MEGVTGARGTFVDVHPRVKMKNRRTENITYNFIEIYGNSIDDNNY
jgi:hypothetical protein